MCHICNICVCIYIPYIHKIHNTEGFTLFRIVGDRGRDK